ncbi:hypothetical protein FS749_001411 [Ceratobasidium sp. UAMH 11750]|nr:hypothetical protein FS749_001411 [Ceratobasidium sp. UAMH 11750]
MLRPLSATTRRAAMSMSAFRLQTISRHMSGTVPTDDQPVLFTSEGYVRTYTLNRPKSLNTLNEQMIDMLSQQVKAWDENKLCKLVIGRGTGRAFCAGGDVKDIVANAAIPEKQPAALQFFQKEFQLDFALATLSKPYVALMDGITMGGGVGLAIGAPFRVATETSQFAMPETKIGYCPDVGATYFLPRLDGELGTYLALTANVVKARSILELGLATHYVPQRRLPALVAALSSLAEPSAEAINQTIEEHSAEISPDDPPASYAGERRAVLDACFSHKSVDSIMQALKDVAASTGTQARWAAETLAAMEARSPTSLRVALEAVRRGKHMQLADALQMEMGIAAAFCTGASPDFVTGVNALLVEKSKERPGWSPATLEETRPDVIKKFFDDSAYVASAPRLELNRSASGDRLLRYALPSEGVVQAAIQGSLPGSGSFALTPAELVASFEGKYGQKIGMRQKLEEIIDRRCKVVDGYLEWRH